MKKKLLLFLTIFFIDTKVILQRTLTNTHIEHILNICQISTEDYYNFFIIRPLQLNMNIGLIYQYDNLLQIRNIQYFVLNMLNKNPE
jgi:hypothetical protein